MGNIKRAARYFLFRERVNISKRVNWFLFLLRRIPWLGKKISPRVYQAYQFKHILFWLVAVVSVISSMVLRGAMIGASAGIVWLFDAIIHRDGSGMGMSEYLLGGLFFWLVLTIGLGLYDIWFSQVDPKTLEFMDNFQLSKKFFAKAYLLVLNFTNTIYYIAIAILIGWFLDSWLIAIGMPILYITSGYLCYYLARLVLSKNAIPLMRQSIIIIVGGLVAIAIGGLLPILTNTVWIENIIFSPVVIVVSILISMASLYGIVTFKREDAYLAQVLDRSTSISENVKNIHVDTATGVQKKMTMTDTSGKFENRKGSSYLNAVLFSRYQKMFRKIILIRLGITGVIIVASVAATLFLTDTFGEVAFALIPALNIIIIPMWVSMFSVGRKVVQIVFLNCDNAMLHYPFYRKKEIIMSGFFDRLKRTFVLNSVLIIAPLFMAFLIGFSNEMDFSFVGITAIILVSILVLFSFHELFLYYMIQPFAADMQVKNPLYTIITMVSSMAIWMVIGGGFGGGMDLMDRLFGSQWQVALILAGITVGYMVVGIFALYKFAPKTFKAKS